MNSEKKAALSDLVDSVKIDKKLGRPRELSKGRAIVAYLDEETIEEARKIGSGNFSLGIRIAFKAYNTYTKLYK